MKVARSVVVLVLAILLMFGFGVTGGLVVLLDTRSQAEANSRVLQSNSRVLAVNRANGEAIKEALAVMAALTGPEAQVRSSAVVANAIADLRRSIDCVALIHEDGQRPPACTEVAARLDAIRAGLDPFTP